MIQFRCWYCNKKYSMSEERIGERLTCTCEQKLRVPKRSGGNCRVKTVIDWLVEAIVYGGGGALLGLGLAILLLSQMRGSSLVTSGPGLIGVFTLVGFVFGLLGGERGINWIGRMIRDQEDNR